MSDTIVIALISLAGTCLGSLFGILAANKLTVYRLEQLEKKVDKHNGVIERVFKLEQRDAVEEEKIEEMDKKISALQSYHRG